MAIRFYDEAIVNKIQKWIKDPNMVVLKPNEVSRLWKIRADQQNDKPLTLPLIAISRQPNINIQTATKRSLSFDGEHLEANPIVTMQLNAIPIEISYQIDIYTQRYEEGDEYLRNFIFNFVNYPKMSITIPYNGSEIEHVCNIRLQPSVSDNSDISEKLFADEFTRWTINIDIHDAYLFSVPVNTNAKVVGIELDVQDTYSPNIKMDQIEAIDLIEKDRESNN